MKISEDRYKNPDEQPDKKPLIGVTRTISRDRFFVVAWESYKGTQIEREIYLTIQDGTDRYDLDVSVTRPKWQLIRALRQCLVHLAKSVLHYLR